MKTTIASLVILVVASLCLAAEQTVTWNPITWFEYHYNELSVDQDRIVSQLARQGEAQYAVEIGNSKAPKSSGQIIAYKMMNFWKEARSYRDSANYPEIFKVYGLLKSGNYTSNTWKEMSFLKDEKTQDMFIETAAPFLKQAWAATEPTERALMRELLSDMKSWVPGINVELERAYLEALRKNGNRYESVKKVKIMPSGKFLNEGSFPYVDANGNERKHGKAEAFVLRRILASDISKERFMALTEKFSEIIVALDKELGLSPVKEAETLVPYKPKEPASSGFTIFDPKASRK